MTSQNITLIQQKLKYFEQRESMIFLEQDIPKKNFDKNIIDSEKFQEYFCIICQQFAHVPYTCRSCKNCQFCKVCYERWKSTQIKNRKQYHCPNCRSQKEPTVLNFLEKMERNQVEIKCGKKSCKQKELMKLPEYIGHFKSCGKVWKKILCPMNCYQILRNKKQYLDHYEQCPNLKIQCEKCLKLIKQCEKINHLNFGCQQFDDSSFDQNLNLENKKQCLSPSNFINEIKAPTSLSISNYINYCEEKIVLPSSPLFRSSTQITGHGLLNDQFLNKFCEFSPNRFQIQSLNNISASNFSQINRTDQIQKEFEQYLMKQENFDLIIPEPKVNFFQKSFYKQNSFNGENSSMMSLSTFHN